MIPKHTLVLLASTLIIYNKMQNYCGVEGCSLGVLRWSAIFNMYVSCYFLFIVSVVLIFSSNFKYLQNQCLNITSLILVIVLKFGALNNVLGVLLSMRILCHEEGWRLFVAIRLFFSLHVCWSSDQRVVPPKLPGITWLPHLLPATLLWDAVTRQEFVCI